MLGEDEPCNRLLAERVHDIVGVGSVADRVCPAQQHLERNVRYLGVGVELILPRALYSLICMENH